MSSLHAGSPDVHADVEKDHVDRDSEPGSEDSDINVDSNSEIERDEYGEGVAKRDSKR